ncbi:aldehyde dehydrogenase family protein [Halomonas sp. TRM85114]|uniref:aldehyde dehydrogenase family protein n=1 Tax=Halomonas jincaotanensis TaxID=2810616 RepID=UPI001BD21F8F|nr:aldehyde dehydrogenase family protein [Halomonas jincaotanensis]MBS9405488.1 aldehyde dehydrogenase family protein [Halomonas jincaotanensis]
MSKSFPSENIKGWATIGDEAKRILDGLKLPGFDSVWTDGEWDGEVFDNRSGINQSVICSVPQFGPKEIELVVNKANQAVSGSGGWAAMSALERKSKILDFRLRILKHADELAMLDCIDVGKPYQIARAVDVQSAARSLEWYAELADKFYGELAPTNNLDAISYQPLGVVSALVPWNYPIMIAAWKFAPMLAAGNAVILKPAEQSPLSAMRLMEIARESDLPPGVFNVVTGDGETTGQALIQHVDVHGVGFTGSSETGKVVIGAANSRRLKPVSLECGGKSPAVLFDDCNVEKAVKLIAAGIFYNAGQSCNAPTRVLAHESIVEQVIDMFVEEAKEYLPNNPLSGDSKVGSIVDRIQYEKVVSLTEQAVNMGCDVAYGSTERMFEETGGYYISPMVLTNVSRESPAFQEEIFGPILPITSFSTDDEAIELANDSRYGLWANVFTTSLDRALKSAKQIDAGTVATNVTFGGDITTPFGGFKDSGIGRDRSTHALVKYMNVKHTSLVPNS